MLEAIFLEREDTFNRMIRQQAITSILSLSLLGEEGGKEGEGGWRPDGMIFTGHIPLHPVLYPCTPAHTCYALPSSRMLVLLRSKLR